MNSDFKDLLRTFNDAGVKYLVVGGWAYMEHAEPRYTKDIEVWIERTDTNADRVIKALRVFGAPLRELTHSDLTTAGTFFQIGLPPNRIDIITQLEEMDFASCWQRRKSVSLGEISVDYISLDDLIENKERTGRPHDLADAEHLRTARGTHKRLTKNEHRPHPRQTNQRHQTSLSELPLDKLEKLGEMLAELKYDVEQ